MHVEIAECAGCVTKLRTFSTRSTRVAFTRCYFSVNFAFFFFNFIRCIFSRPGRDSVGSVRNVYFSALIYIFHYYGCRIR